MFRWTYMMCAAVAFCGCDLLPPVPFTLKVVPTEIVDSIPGQRCVLLVTVEDEAAECVLTLPVHISASAADATVTVENQFIQPGEVAEVSVIPAPEKSGTGQFGDQTEGREITVTVRARRGTLEETATVPITISSEEEDLVGPLAEEVRDLFISWLAENRPELGITAQTVWTGTIVTPHILVVTHYLYFSPEWEMHVYWHVMIPPYDWARIELRRRFQETLPSLAFEIPSRSADPIEVNEIEPEGTLWR
ncbi:MAG TPA: hypothetical protein VM487_01330 [Phycisphaerae bacterium]|nr:hypothetical protein [Phycisphaerae bacterium]